jgi:hypothetical protein
MEKFLQGTPTKINFFKNLGKQIAGKTIASEVPETRPPFTLPSPAGQSVYFLPKIKNNPDENEPTATHFLKIQSEKLKMETPDASKYILNFAER